ncbi:hypothetical protein L596_028993 [Steinernema carpocapsae]|uniref:Uncharacterized protein n=1 Tax=Steinernema carpocapsae TaxID=34508 RepID=A0A4U5LTB0_STECR|nr:hypothetical protein L596_028993 [Steinernema carpocapsae]
MHLLVGIEVNDIGWLARMGLLVALVASRLLVVGVVVVGAAISASPAASTSATFRASVPAVHRVRVRGSEVATSTAARHRGVERWRLRVSAGRCCSSRWCC